MVTSGNKELDQFLDEQKDKICLVYGPPASGKTTLALMFAVNTAKKRDKVIYLDTEEGFSTKRIEQMGKNIDFLENIFVLKSLDFDEQSKNMKKIRDMFGNGKISLVVVDTLSMHYRLELRKDSFKANKRLAYQLDILKNISKKIPIIITNQVYTNVETNKVSMVGGKMVYDYGDKIISLEKEPERKICLIKPYEKSSCFEICDSGFLLK
jgi:DNA repair protein RadB